jgi:hypothetical protein
VKMAPLRPMKPLRRPTTTPLSEGKLRILQPPIGSRKYVYLRCQSLSKVNRIFAFIRNFELITQITLTFAGTGGKDERKSES